MDIEALVRVGQSVRGDRKLATQTFLRLNAEYLEAAKTDEDASHLELLDVVFDKEMDVLEAQLAAKSWAAAFETWDRLRDAWWGAQHIFLRCGFVPWLESAERALELSGRMKEIEQTQTDYLRVHVYRLQKKRETRGNPF